MGRAGCPTGELEDAFFGWVAAQDGASTAAYVHRHATGEQALELLRLRSVYHLKESDPTAWAVPRLPTAAKAALMELQYDEYGTGDPNRLHAHLFEEGLEACGLDPAYGAYVDEAPLEVLEQNNAMSLMGLHRRLRGAALGHLAAFEATSSMPSRRMVQGLSVWASRAEIVAYYEEHVAADAVHEQLAIRTICGSLVRAEPALLADVYFGAFTCLDLEDRGPGGCWRQGRAERERRHVRAPRRDRLPRRAAAGARRPRGRGTRTAPGTAPPGRSARSAAAPAPDLPWCDGTHKVLPPRRPPRALLSRPSLAPPTTPTGRLFAASAAVVRSSTPLAVRTSPPQADARQPVADRAACSRVPSCRIAEPPSSRCRPAIRAQARATSRPSSPPSMATSGSSGNRAVSARGTQGGSAMTSANRSSAATASSSRPSRTSTRWARPAASALRRAKSQATGFRSTQTRGRAGERDGEQPDLAGPRAELEHRTRPGRRSISSATQRDWSAVQVRGSRTRSS